MPQLFGFTLVDLFALLILIFYAVEGISLGFILSSLDLISFLLSFILALKFYAVCAYILVSFFSIPKGFADAVGFFLVALISEIISSTLSRVVYRHFRLHTFLPTRLQVWEHYAGALPGLASAFVILAFLANVIVSLPASPYVKQQITASKTGSALLASSSVFEKRINTIFGGAIHDTLTFMTVEPKSTETVALHFTVKNGSVDEAAEQEMLVLVNRERLQRNLAPLTMDSNLQALARSYSQDMFAHGYFSHYNMKGESPFDRMEKAGIEYSYAGENLALAPSTSLAMQGLMNSPGHRENILKPEFRKIGIGCIDGGIYGKMFTQEFTD